MSDRGPARMSAQLAWDRTRDYGNGQVRTQGRIGDLVLAEVWPDRSKKGDRYWLHMFLAPLPQNLDDMTLTSKSSERQAKATCQRIINAYTKLLTGK